MRKRLSDLLDRFKVLVLEYGVTALVVHYVIFALVIVGFWAAIRLGWQPAGTAANVGAWTAAYVMSKIVQPLRIVATLAVTPFVARMYEQVFARITGRLPGSAVRRASRSTESTPVEVRAVSPQRRTDD